MSLHQLMGLSEKFAAGRIGPMRVIEKHNRRLQPGKLKQERPEDHRQRGGAGHPCRVRRQRELGQCVENYLPARLAHAPAQSFPDGWRQRIRQRIGQRRARRRAADLARLRPSDHPPTPARGVADFFEHAGLAHAGVADEQDHRGRGGVVEPAQQFGPLSGPADQDARAVGAAAGLVLPGDGPSELAQLALRLRIELLAQGA